MTTGVMLHRRVGLCRACVANSSASTYPSVLRPNKRLQLTAFGARDRAFFEAILCRAWAADMSQIPATTRNRIEAQGFLGFDYRALTEIDYWLRLSPAICMVWAQSERP